MSQYALGTIVIAVIAAVAEVGLSIATTAAAPPPLPWLVFLMAFLVGPLAFLALLAWRRRRAQPGRSRLVLLVTVLVAAAGVGVIGTDYFFSRTNPTRRILDSNPVLLPILQWVAVLAVWAVLEVAEGREKRSAASVPGESQKTT